MNYCGLICEYNPLHSGHVYQLEKIKELSFVDGIICAMSGNFVQRAEPSIVSKDIRTRLALENGADAVVQIPTAFTISGGERFSSAAIGILSAISGLKYLAFGCETENFQMLEKLAEIRANENDLFKNTLQTFLDSGSSYPRALCEATAAVCKDKGMEKQDYDAILAKPNNILAIEYLKIIYKNNYNIQPIFIHRHDNYNSSKLTGRFTSASSIRAAILGESFVDSADDESSKPQATGLKTIEDYLPYPPQILVNNLVDYQLFDQLLLFSLRKCGARGLSQLADCAEGIENKLYKNARSCTSLYSALEKTKSKRYTFARLRRIALEALLGITKDCVNSGKTMTYGKLLGIRTEFKRNLSDFSGDIIVSFKDTLKISLQHVKKHIEIDSLADDIFSQLVKKPAGSFFKNKLIEV